MIGEQAMRGSCRLRCLATIVFLVDNSRCLTMAADVGAGSEETNATADVSRLQRIYRWSLRGSEWGAPCGLDMLQEYLGHIRAPLDPMGTGTKPFPAEMEEVLLVEEGPVEEETMVDAAQVASEDEGAEASLPAVQAEEPIVEEEVPWSKAASFTLTLDCDIATFGDVDAFKQTVINDVSKAASVATRFLKVVRIRAGSVLVDMLLSSAAGDRASILAGLMAQLESPESMLMQGEATCKAAGLNVHQDKEESEAMLSEQGEERAEADADQGADRTCESAVRAQQHMRKSNVPGEEDEEEEERAEPEGSRGAGSNGGEDVDGVARGRKAGEKAVEEEEAEEVLEFSLKQCIFSLSLLGAPGLGKNNLGHLSCVCLYTGYLTLAPSSTVCVGGRE